MRRSERYGMSYERAPVPWWVWAFLIVWCSFLGWAGWNVIQFVSGLMS